VIDDYQRLPLSTAVSPLKFLSGIFWIIATDAPSEVTDSFAQTAADLGQLRWAENH
jgi:hypothetical protein